MVTVITIGVKRTDLGLVVVMKTVVHPCLHVIASTIQCFQICPH